MDITQQKEWYDETFSGIELIDSDFTNYSFEECVFESCNFQGGSWANATFISCEFRDCSLINLQLNNSKLNEVFFQECKLVGLDFSICKPLLFSVQFKASQILMCGFSGMDLHELSFGRSALKECDFFQVNLEKADFSGCDLNETVFEGCNLMSASFHAATNYKLDPTKNKVKNARFSMPEVVALLAPLGIEIEN